MAQPYLGEIRIFAGNYPPKGWAFCDGQLLPISENVTLFQLIGITYGGDGYETFALPDLRGRLPIHHGSNQGISYQLAETGGVEEVLLTSSQIPSHSHPLLASARPATSAAPAAGVFAEAEADLYNNEGIAPNASLVASAIAPTGGSQPHTNMQPYLCLNYIISLYGIFPSPT